MNIKSKTLCGIYIVFILQTSVFAQTTCKKGIITDDIVDGYDSSTGETLGIPEDVVCEADGAQCLRIEMDDLYDNDNVKDRKFFKKST